MPENAQTESSDVPVNYNNLVLKRWLLSVGPVRRCEVLKKLKEDLRDLGLSRRQVHRGLLQLATKPHVVLTRLSPCRQYGSKTSLEENENRNSDSCRTDALFLEHSRLGNQEVQTSSTTKNSMKEDNKLGQKSERLSIRVSINNIQGLVVPNPGPKLMSHPSGMLHSFEKALEQLDNLMCSKMNGRETSSNKRTSTIVSADSTYESRQKDWAKSSGASLNEKSRKDENQNANIEGVNIRSSRMTPELIHDKVGASTVHISDQTKKSRIKLNLKSCYSKKGTEYTKSDIYKKVDTDNAKLDVDKKLHSGKKSIDSSKVECIVSRDKYLKHESNGRVLAGAEIGRIEDNTCKRKVYETVTSDCAQRRKKICAFVDENRESDKKKRRKLTNKLRMYFGECITASEDEQEQNILEKRFKRRRQKDSVDSCDSGVCVTESRIATSILETLIDTQKSIPDSTTHEEFNEDASKNTTAHNVTASESEEITESNKAVDRTENVTSVIEVVKNKIQHETLTEEKDTEKEEVSQEKLENPSDRNAIITSNVVETSLITEQLETNTLTAEENLATETEARPEVKQEAEAQPELEQEVEAQLELRQEAEAQPEPEQEVEAQPEPEVTAGTEAEERTDIDSICETPKICSSNNDTHAEASQSQENTLDTGIFNELLQMSFAKKYHITVNGNVLSIQETIEEAVSQNFMNKDVDENGNLKVSPEVQATSNNQDVQKQVSGHVEKNNNVLARDMPLIFDEEENAEAVPISSTHVPCNVNEPTTQNPEPNAITEKKDEQPNKVLPGRLRVLSSAELGARWCPTPVNTVTSTVAQTNAEIMPKVPLEYATTVAVSSATLVTQTAPPTVPISTVPVSTSSSPTIVSPEFAESVDITFVRIYNLIQSLRVSSPISKLDYNKLLHTEFEKLRKVLNTDNYVALIEGALCVLNAKLLTNRPLSLSELFRNSSSLKVLYLRCSEKINKYQRHLNSTPTAMSSQMTSNQNAHCSQQSLHSASTLSVLTKLQNLFFASNTKSKSSASIPPKQPQQAFKEKAPLQPQNNVFQSNMGMNSAAANNQCMHQQNYKISAQRTLQRTQQKAPNAYVVKQKPMTNMYATKVLPTQHSAVPPTGVNPLAGKHIPAPITNATFINQQYVPQRVFVPPVNAFYNVKPPNYPVQQNIKTAHGNMQNVGMPPVGKQYQTQGTISVLPVYNIPQENQVQNVSQYVPLNYIPQPVQTMFSGNIPRSMPKNIPQNNEKISQRVPPQVQMKVPQNHAPEQLPSSSQHSKNTYSCKLKQPVFLAKRKETCPVSLESTTKMFDVLKYLSDAQKATLLKHMDFYFSCTTWLQQEFTSEQWQKIHMERSSLLHFHTLLRHLVEKSVKEPPKNSEANTAQSNILTSIKIGVPKTVQITVRENEENEGIRCQVDVSKTGLNKTTNVDQICMPGEENRRVITISNLFNNEHKEMDNSQRKEHSNRSQISYQEADKKGGVHKNKPTEEPTLSQVDNSVVMPNLETRVTLNSNVHQKDGMEKETEASKSLHKLLNPKKHSSDGLEKIVDDAFQAVEDRTSVVSSSKLFNQDTLQHSSLHLVTVEISSNSDQVTVIDTNIVSENNPTNKDLMKREQLQGERLDVADALPSLKNNVHEEPAISSSAILGDFEHLNDAEDDSLLEEPTISRIADVRSISLETFQKMEESNNVPPNTTEEKIEEEEIKICLLCGKPSTVACSICLEAKYCSKDCFRLHWEEHYIDCRPVETIYS